MSTTIVLIRHGKAAPAQEGQHDADRTLTTAGKRSLERSLPEALAPLAEAAAEGRLSILTSPYVRARQTAKIACAALGLDPATPEKCAELAGDDPKAIVACARACEADVVVMVGHTPTLDKSTQLLCGTRLPLRPGAVACLRLVDEFNGPDNLAWFVQGPLVGRWERRECIEDEAARLGKALGRCYRGFVDDPNDVAVVGELHDTIRSLRALLTFAAPLLKRKACRSAIEDLDALADLTSRLHADDLLAARITPSELVSDELVASLAALRAHEAETALSGFAARKSQRAFDNVRSLARALPWKGPIAEKGIAPGVLEERFALLHEDLRRQGEDFDATDEGDLFATHRRVCQLLSVIDLIELPLGADAGLATRLRAMQERLGELREARTTLDIVDAGPLAALSKEAAADLARLRAQEEERTHALEAALHPASS